MNEAQAAEYYQEQKEKGSGAHLYKQGLGFTGPPGPRPSAPRPAPPSAAPAGPLYGSGPPARPPPPGGMPFPGPQFQGPPGRPLLGRPPPPGGAPFGMPGPPGMMQPGMQPMPGYPPGGMRPPPHWPPGPHMRPPPPQFPPQHIPPGQPFARPPPPPQLHPHFAPQQPLPRPAQPPPHPQMPPHQPWQPPQQQQQHPNAPPQHAPAGAYPQHAPQHAQHAQQLQQPGPPRQPQPTLPAGPPSAIAASAPSSQPGAAAPAGTQHSAGGQSQAEAGAWTAHKTDAGQVYYHNTLTGQSAWERPAGYKGDAAAAGKQAVPVASLPVKGTQWTEVACQDGQKYYYHTATQETTWSMPEEVRAAKARTAQGPSAISAAAAAHISRLQAANGAASHADGPEEDVSFSQDDIRPPWEVATAAAAPQPTAVALQPNGAPPQHPHPHSHPHAHPSEAQPHEAPANIQPPLPSAQPHGVPGDALRPSTAAPAAAAVPPPLPPKTRDDLEREFKDLLIEKGVTAFSRWERELPKLITDPRYKALPTLKDRRLVFDNFCKNVAEEHRQRQAHKAASVDEDFRALLEEALMPAAETAREAAEGGEPEVTEEAAEAGASGRGGAAGEETGVAGLGPDATLEQLEQYWGNDPRWKACDDAQRQRLFAAHVGPLRRASQQQKEDSSRALLAEFRALLAESGVDAKARWSKTKDQVGSDARYRGLPREEREPAFRAYVAELQAAAEAARKERKEAEERDREARKRSAREAEAAEARRKQAAHADAVAAYQTLLMEVVKDAAANWRDWKPRLERDPQGRAANPDLPKAEVESLFRDHVRSIADQNRAAYISLLDEVVRPLLPSKRSEELPPALSSFVNARGLMQDDPRFSRLPESQQEYEWRKFVGDLIFERDNPAAAAAQRRERENGLARAGGRGLPSERERERRQERSAQDAGEVTDKAYQREYLDHDRKRIKRD